MEELIRKTISSFSEILTPETVEAHTLLNERGNRCKELYLVKKGVLRSFYYQNGIDVTAHFCLDHGIIGNIDSIMNNSSTLYSIETLEKSEVYSINYNELEDYLEIHPGLEKLVRQLTQKLYFDLVERINGITFLSAKERYDRLLADQPGLEQRVKLGHIASYLGITQETLSRIRNR